MGPSFSEAYVKVFNQANPSLLRLHTKICQDHHLKHNAFIAIRLAGPYRSECTGPRVGIHNLADHNRWLQPPVVPTTSASATP